MNRCCFFIGVTLADNPVSAHFVALARKLAGKGHHVVIISPQDVRGIADAISKIITDEPLRYSLVEAGRRYAQEKFDMWKNGKQMKDVLL